LIYEKSFTTISKDNTTNEDSEFVFGLWRMLFDKSCLQRILFHGKNLACGAFFP